jgi:hypothetical protein
MRSRMQEMTARARAYDNVAPGPLCLPDLRSPPAQWIVEVIEEDEPQGKQITAPSVRARSFLGSRVLRTIHFDKIADGY